MLSLQRVGSVNTAPEQEERKSPGKRSDTLAYCQRKCIKNKTIALVHHTININLYIKDKSAT